MALKGSFDKDIATRRNAQGKDSTWCNLERGTV
ncbi:hypothetical protein CCACVL1_25661 [Corchorus capsularis]|uniref:Uncharacterized protein n=1 Tax=Corchorus capsularis TaxID=210143 RepID=A0A1R3GIH9_COCAP|nr:hypothetical protein CCACVL1_25661 [Corchorus capsularis]